MDYHSVVDFVLGLVAIACLQHRVAKGCVIPADNGSASSIIEVPYKWKRCLQTLTYSYKLMAV
jgi:hypothetical protein